MILLQKSPSESRVEMTQIVLPGDANPLGTAFGGRVMQWMDVAAAVAARRHSEGIVVTASMDSLQFIQPVQLGDVVVLYASVNRAWRTSMEVGVRVECERGVGNVKHHTASAYLTFVALDEKGIPRPVSLIIPETDEQKRRFVAAENRRKIRLSERENAKK